MRLLLITVVLFMVGYNVSGWNIKKSPLIQKLQLKTRQARAATTCQDAYQETLSPQFEQCEDYLSSDSGEEYTTQDLDSFCNAHCIRTMLPVFRDLVTLCDESVSQCSRSRCR